MLKNAGQKSSLTATSVKDVPTLPNRAVDVSIITTDALSNAEAGRPIPAISSTVDSGSKLSGGMADSGAARGRYQGKEAQGCHRGFKEAR